MLIGLIVSLKFMPVVNQQNWNPLKHKLAYQYVDEQGYEVPANGRGYIIQENTLFRNVPSTQSRNVFSWIDKYEFMQVNELTRMGFDDEYLIAEQNSRFILYNFGEKQMRVYTTEHDLYYDLNQMGHPIKMFALEAYNDKSE
nr:DUF4930 family protein [Staphylococcus canis]